MDAGTIEQLERYSDQLALAVKGLRDRLHMRNGVQDVDAGTAQAKASILASVEGIRTLLDEPNEFLQRLTIQVRVSAHGLLEGGRSAARGIDVLIACR